MSSLPFGQYAPLAFQSTQNIRQSESSDPPHVKRIPQKPLRSWCEARRRKNKMEIMIRPYIFCAALLVGMLMCLELGRYLGNRNLKTNPAGLTAGYSAVGGAIFGLYGLLLAFTFSGAPSRYDMSRRQVQEEANAIGTAYLRLDLLSPEDQPVLRERFRQYVDSRLEVYRRLPDVAAAEQELSKSSAIQLAI